MIPFDDRGLTLGDGLFETILAENGDLVFWDEHVTRLIEGCATLSLPGPSPTALMTAAKAALADAGLSAGRAAVRLTWTAGSAGRGLERPPAPAPRMFATAAPAPIPTGPLRLITSTVRRNDGSPTSRLKTLSYLDNILARREALVAGADEALMLNSRGEAACAAAANLFWITDGRLFTPLLECGVLAGIMRAAVIAWAEREGAPVQQRRAGLEALARADAMLLTNSLIGVRIVSHLDGRGFAPSRLAQQAVQDTLVVARGRR